jgi:hypothetical protein
VQRDLYSAFLAAHLNLQTFLPSLAQDLWESAETRLRAAGEATIQRANAGQVLPQSMGIPRAGARLLKSLVGVKPRAWPPAREPGKAGTPPRTSQPLGLSFTHIFQSGKIGR